MAQPNGKSSLAVTHKAALISLCPCEGAKESLRLQGQSCEDISALFSKKEKKKEGKWREGGKRLLSHGLVRLSTCPTALDGVHFLGKKKAPVK